MNYNEPIVTNPFFQQPITITSVAVSQRSFRQIHCIECGMPFIDMTDRIVIVSDAGLPIEYTPMAMRLLGARCPRKRCKQHFRMEIVP